MRSSLRGMTGLVATGLFTLTAITAANAAVERELLRVKIWATYKDVLAKHGQPTRIEIGAVESPLDSGGAAGGVQQARGGGGLPGMSGMGGPGASMGAGKTAAMAVMPGASGGGGGGGQMATMMGGQMAASRRMSQMNGGMNTGSMGGANMMATMMGGGPGGGRMGGGPGGGGLGAPMGGRGMMGGGGAAASSEDEGEITWIYEKGPLTYMFLFNKDGKVIQISEYGYNSPFATEHGVRLGDPVMKVYQLYGWSAQTSKTGDQLTLDYSTGQHVAFQLVSQGKGARVVGIVVALAEKTRIPGGGPGAGAGSFGGPGMGGGLPGFGGLPGAGKGGAGAGASD